MIGNLHLHAAIGALFSTQQGIKIMNYHTQWYLYMKYNQGSLHPSGDYIQQERGIRFRLPLRLLPASGRCHSWQHLPQHSRHIHTNHRFPKMSVGGSLKERFCSKIDFFFIHDPISRRISKNLKFQRQTCRNL